MKTYQRHSHGRMFENDFLEACSKVHPVTPVLIYVPLVLAAMGYALSTGLTRPVAAAVLFAVGWVIWSFSEYAIHRFFFHWEGIGPISRRIHDVAHGYHHNYPDDAMRLVMPLGASIPLAILVAGILWLVTTPATGLPIFAGIVSGYLFYDITHWATHARTPRTAWGKAIRSHHMAHHFACPDKNFGISHRWVDTLIGTMRKRPE